VTIETRDDLTATGDAWLLTPREILRLGLPIMAGAFVVGVERRCGTPSVCLCLTLADAVAMLTGLQIDTLQIFCVRSEESEYRLFAECQAAMDRKALH
jgi:hypothetical protein